MSEPNITPESDKINSINSTDSTDSTSSTNSTDLAKLRQMTGAPDIHQPLVSQNAFADVNISSERPVWKLPLPKLMFIAIALIPVFGLAGFFFIGHRGTQQQATDLEKSPEADSSTEVGEATTDLAKAEQEIASLKSKMALDDQAYIQRSSQSAQTLAASSKSSSRNTSSNKPLPAAASARTAISTAPPTISYRPSPPAIQTSTPVVSPSRFVASRSEPTVQPTSFVAESRDPFEYWRQLAQVGSYGGTSASEATSVNAPVNTAMAADGSSGSVQSGRAAVPVAYFASTSAIAPPTKPTLFSEGSSVELASVEGMTAKAKDGPLKPAILNQDRLEEPAKTQEPAVLAEAEAKILEEQLPNSQPLSNQTFDNQPQMLSLMAGEYASGELITPIVLDSEGVGDHFLVVLSEPLVDNAGSVAIPAGGMLMVQIDRASEGGLVQLSAVQAIWEEQGLKRELVLPDRTILIRGDRGNPLVAESYGSSGGDIASMDMGQFALGAIRRVGELYTRSDSLVQTGNGATVITESNPAPNILAGALEGGADAVLGSITERNQRAIEKLEQRSTVPYIPAGRSIQVFVNQSMQMPAGL